MSNDFQDMFKQYSSKKRSEQFQNENDIIQSDPHQYLPQKRKKAPTVKIEESSELNKKSDTAIKSFAERLKESLSPKNKEAEPIVESSEAESTNKLEQPNSNEEQIVDVVTLLNDLNKRINKLEENFNGIRESTEKIKEVKGKYNFVVKRDANGKISSIEASDE